MRLWLIKERGLPASQKIPGGEQGMYAFWDPENWEKSRKEMTVMYADLEEKNATTFQPGVTGTQQVQATTTVQQQQTQIAQRAGYQGLGM
jgi:CCR4-NOT transcription complex subunit 2